MNTLQELLMAAIDNGIIEGWEYVVGVSKIDPLYPYHYHWIIHPMGAFWDEGVMFDSNNSNEAETNARGYLLQLALGLK